MSVRGVGADDGCRNVLLLAVAPQALMLKKSSTSVRCGMRQIFEKLGLDTALMIGNAKAP